LTGTAAEVTPVSQIGDNNFAVVDMIKKFDENYSRLVNKK
jgi:branched-chain amino acid aminotransferase